MTSNTTVTVATAVVAAPGRSSLLLEKIFGVAWKKEAKEETEPIDYSKKMGTRQEKLEVKKKQLKMIVVDSHEKTERL